MDTMATLVFDTHKAVKTLREAGFEETQAEAMVETVGNAMGENVATKADIEPLATKADVANEFKALYRHLWIMAAGIVGVTVMLMKVIP